MTIQLDLQSSLQDSFKKLTGDQDSYCMQVTNYNTGDQDFTAQLTNIKAKNPDVIFAPGNFTESALVIKQARQLGITASNYWRRYLGNTRFLDIGKEAVEGVEFSTFFATKNQLQKNHK